MPKIYEYFGLIFLFYSNAPFLFMYMSNQMKMRVNIF